VVDPDLLFLGRFVGRELVGLEGNSIESVIFTNAFLGRFAKNSIGFLELRKKLLHVVLAQRHSKEPTPATLECMERPIKFEHTRYLGDKRTQLVYDVDNWSDPAIIDDIVCVSGPIPKLKHVIVVTRWLLQVKLGGCALHAPRNLHG
jgi:hypothetical protein